MSHVLLIHEPLAQRDSRTEAEGRAAYDAMVTFSEELRRRGIALRAVESLGHARKGTRVSVRDGRTQMLDGPFAEAKEMVGGFYLLDGVSHAQALAIAAECPAAKWCTVEVRETAPCWVK